MKLKKLIILSILFCLITLCYSLNATKTFADQSTINFNNGVLELGTKNFDQAIAYFQAALKANPYHIKAYNNLGIALQKKGDFNNAIIAYQQALKLDPRYGNAYYNLGLCLKDAGRNAEAVEALQAFVNFNPTDSDAVRAKWIANDLRETLGKVDEKTRQYYLGSWLISDLNYTDAVKPLQDALMKDSNDIRIRYALGLAMKRLGNHNGALEQFNAVIQQNNQDALAYYEMGECFESLGNMTLANQAWQNYINLAPYAESASNLKTRAASAQQQVQSAQQQSFMQNTVMQNNPQTFSNQPVQQNSQPPQQYEQPSQQYAQSVPQYSQPPQQYSQPAPQYSQPVQQYSQPAQQYSQPAPQYSQPVQQYSQPAPQSYSQIVPQYNQPQTTYGAGFSSPSPGTQAARAGKTRIAVLDFDYSAVRPWWNGQWDVGKGVSSLIVGELVRSGVFSVVERTALDQILQEQKLSTSSLFDPSTAANVGKLLGIDVLVMGNVTQFGIENKQGGISTALPFAGIASGIQSKKSLASVSFDMRVVSVDTGEILNVTTVTGRSKRRGLMLDFARNGNAGGIDFSSSNFQDSVLGEASIAAAQKASELLNTQYEKVTRATIDSTSQDVGVVAYVGAQGVIINAGGQSGLKVGNRLSIERMMDVVKDPVSGNIIKALTAPIGELEITEIESSSATGRMVSGGMPQVGDLARFRADMNVVVPPTGASTAVTAEIMYKKPKKNPDNK